MLSTFARKFAIPADPQNAAQGSSLHEMPFADGRQGGGRKSVTH
jgi:hypothetical protein